MKKILLVFDGIHYSEGAFEFARMMNETERVMITGVFLPQVDYANLWSHSAGTSGALFIPMLEDEEADVIQKNISRFERSCRNNLVQYRVHKDFFDLALPELIKETRFADLVILGSELFYKNLGAYEPNDYLKEALHEAECPVLVVPEHFDFPDSTVLAYDGSASSMYAIKQFVYLFPWMRRNKTLLVYVNDTNEKLLPDELQLKEWAGRHFPDLTIMKLEIDPKKYFATWIGDRKNTILVTGAYGRSSFSQFFKKSFVTDVIHDHRLPVFITHR